ncbi:hypothetical protein [Cellulosimicrobium arenosum]|uniref:Uncharacterized protein n=1 Tax=Cellulosimicrobium arenosum TaxID=2708133 RepID=A0A927J099_9MICO|nr:hypothetical protein [Cellulosimicrobium arenosum]MBD8079492.1 hypothetical protein [Cellulosimicrobium arenosum]
MANSTPAPTHHSSGDPLEHPRRDDGPGVARSAVPVVVSVVMLFGLAVAAAFAGRGLLDMLATLMTP